MNQALEDSIKEIIKAYKKGKEDSTHQHNQAKDLFIEYSEEYRAYEIGFYERFSN